MIVRDPLRCWGLIIGCLVGCITAWLLSFGFHFFSSVSRGNPAFDSIVFLGILIVLVGGAWISLGMLALELLPERVFLSNLLTYGLACVISGLVFLLFSGVPSSLGDIAFLVASTSAGFVGYRLVLHVGAPTNLK